MTAALNRTLTVSANALKLLYSSSGQCWQFRPLPSARCNEWTGVVSRIRCDGPGSCRYRRRQSCASGSRASRTAPTCAEVWQSQPLPARQDQGDAIDDGNNLYWISRGRQLLIATLLHVVTDLTREHHTLTEVRRLVNSAAANPEGFAEVFARSRHPEVRAIAGNLQIKAD